MKQLLLAAILLINLSGMAQINNNFSLTGEINNAQYDVLYLSYENINGIQKEDSTKIKNGKFQFHGKIKEPTMAYLKGTVQSQSVDDPNMTLVFLEPSDMSIHLVANDFKSFKIKGSKTQDELSMLEKSKTKIRESKQPIIDAYSAEQDPIKAAEIREQFAPYDEQMDKLDLEFIRSHPDSYLSAYLMRFKLSKLTANQAQEIFNNWSQTIQESSYGSEISKGIENLANGSPGATAYVFSTSDIDGNKLSLSDYKGRYVLIDFWASWCVPCRKGNPHLIEIYNKYKDQGLEIIGVASDDQNHSAWRNAIKQDKIGIWKHVLSGLKQTDSGFDKSKAIGPRYGIHTLPTKILIDPNGIIVGRYGGGGQDDAAMDKKLAEIFQ